MYSIYVHINKVNGKCYVGTSCKLKDRWSGNGSHYMVLPKFGNALRKYGWNGFTHNIIDEVSSKEEANVLEQQYIKQYDSFNNGYNATTGGRINFEHSEETKYKMRKPKSEEHKNNMRKSRIGRKLSAEHKRNIGKSGKGRKVPKDVLEKLLIARNKYWSNGGIEKQREFAMGNTYGNKQVMVYDTLTETDMIYPSIKTFCEEVGLGHHLVISAKSVGCRAGKRYYIENI